MNEKEISIKSALDGIQVPSDQLDRIIEEACKEEQRPAAKITRKRNKWLMSVAASILVLGISAASLTASPALANYLAELPVIGNVFSIFAEEEAGLVSYQLFSEEIGLSETSNDVEISIEQAVYDGTTVTFTYKMISDKKLGPTTQIMGIPEVIELEPGNASMDWETVDGGIAGIVAIPAVLPEEAGQVNVRWEPDTIQTEQGEIEGDWKFEFAVSQLSTDPIALDEQVYADGVTVQFNKITFTDVSINLDYQQLVDPALLKVWENVEAEMIAEDNLGNVYKVPYNGGSVEGGARTREDFKWTATMRGLDPAATKLTFYPFAHVGRYTDERGPESIKIEFDALEIDLIDHSYQFLKDPVIPALPEPEDEEGE